MLMHSEPLLTAADAARILGVVPATVRTLALSGHLEPIAITERGIRLFRRGDVEHLAMVRAEKDASEGNWASHTGESEATR